MKSDYYSIHKNKKPKHIKYNQKSDPFTAISLVTSIIGASELGLISQQQTGLNDKNIAIFKSILNTAKALTVDIPKQRMLHRFTTTGRYVK